MDRELIQDILRRAEMNAAQAEALSRLFAEMATKSDLLVFQDQVDQRLSKVEEQMAHLRTDLTGQMAHLKTDLTRQMAQLKTDLTGQMALLKTDLTGQAAHLKTDLTGHLAHLRADLTGEMARQTRWMIAVVVLFGTVVTIVNAFL